MLDPADDPFLTRLASRLQTQRAKSCWWVAYSGGLDSTVLLHALARLRPHFPDVTLRAIHIHHGLQADADSWAKHCQVTCLALKIPCTVSYAQVQVPKGESLEACAREARYHLFSQHLQANDLLIIAQHADDQAETVLLQLFRGAGTTGLAAMAMLSPFAQATLFRPLLDTPRATLQTWANQQQLHYINDPSNNDTRFTRNFLRHEIIPRLQQRWANINQTLCRVAQHQAEADTLLQELAQTDLNNCQTNQKNQLNINALTCLSPARQRNLLRYWLQQLQFTPPSTAQLAQILETLLPAKIDAQPLVQWQGVEIRRYQNILYALPPLPIKPAHYQQTWLPPAFLTLPLGYLRIKPVLGQGIKPTDIFKVQLRQGGETCQLRGLRRELKTLLQTAHMPAWLRPFLPLIYVNEKLAFIPHLGVCDGFQVSEQEEGWIIEWVIE
ncbi:tRNA(Ile)-lysidine synthetase [Beggiatoa alba B18LD]|uniref:tRNA(Ile)-lysidine synthase n=1 Tax=Beggiatoa alba B18LD TaxID=395493 RepID=I3CG22_9GAMM|nr:tRNA lysidine(34) synthetase TilS [Beggiatoa alba]EIJ42565.1 tRNA(Ile)-lysidine synthetase [Beggiatoa alba B18LD]